jgi:ABC-2 type transport system permease protein
MIITIARKEILETIRDGRFRWAGAMILALLLLSLGFGWRQHQDLERQHRVAGEQTRDNWLTQGQKNPHSAAHYGVYAFKPQLPLALVDRGVNPYTGVAVWLEAHKQNDFKYRPAQDSTSLARFGELTASMVLQVLAPLLIVLLSFGAFPGERENGTLRQLMSLGVPASALAAGKALGLAGALGLLLVPASMAGAAAILLANGQADGGRMLLLALVFLLYFIAFAGVCLAVSAWAKSSRAALVGLLAFWIFNALIAPRLAPDLSKRLYPTPSSHEFAEAMQAEMQEGGEARLAALRQRVMAQYKVDKVDDLPVSWQGITLIDGERHGEEIYDRHYGRLWDQFERQLRFQEAAAFAAPLLGVRMLAMGLAGTDFQQHRHFATAAEQYRRYFIQVMNDDVLNNAMGKTVYLGNNDLWKQAKEFHYTAPGLDWVLAQHSAALAGLTAWALGASFLAWFAVSRLRAE